MAAMECISRIKLLILDVDGVLTDGRTWQDAAGVWRRAFSVRDTMGIRALKKSGVRVAVVTQAKSEDIRQQVSFIGIEDFIEDCDDKSRAVSALLSKHALSPEDVALMSADLLDLPLMSGLGCAITVLNAQPDLRRASHYVTQRAGGDGAVREVCNLILMNGTKMKAPKNGRSAAV